MDKNIQNRGFPGGAVVESPPADAGDTGLCPGPGRSHMPRSGCAREPWPLSLCVRSLGSATGEAIAVRGPRTAKKKKQLKIRRERTGLLTETKLCCFFFFLRYAGLSLLWPLLLRSTGSGRAGSAAIAHGPSHSVACGSFPDRGTNPCPLHRQADCH